MRPRRCELKGRNRSKSGVEVGEYFASCWVSCASSMSGSVSRYALPSAIISLYPPFRRKSVGRYPLVTWEVTKELGTSLRSRQLRAHQAGSALLNKPHGLGLTGKIGGVSLCPDRSETSWAQTLSLESSSALSRGSWFVAWPAASTR